MFCLQVYLGTICVSDACRGRKRVLSSLGLEFEMIVSWKSNMGPLEEQPVFLTTAPSLNVVQIGHTHKILQPLLPKC